MDYYQTITLVADQEIGHYFLWHRFYQRLHYALVRTKLTQQTTDIAVSFPQYRHRKIDDQDSYLLGAQLRVFAPSEARLAALNIAEICSTFSDYLHFTGVKAVPEQHQYLQVTRYHSKDNASIRRAIRRRMQRENCSGSRGQSILQVCKSGSNSLAVYSNG